jgi:hypothetical protein
MMLQLLAAVPSTESRALALKELVPPKPVGVPVIAPVEAFGIKPGGSDPVIEYV